MKTDTVDEKLTRHSFFADEAAFYDLFRTLRREEPVHWTQNPGGKPFWSVFRHADIKRIFEEPEHFSSERGGIMPLIGAEMDAIGAETFGLGENVLVVDPPRHTELRKVIATPFLPVALKDSEARTAQLISEIFDRLPDDGLCDLVDDLGAKIPMAVICDILQVPSADWPAMLRWGQMALGGNDPEFQQGTATETILAGFRNMFRYTGQLGMARRGCPFSDPMTQLANTQVGGRALTESEVAYNGQQLLLAGFETTRNSFAGGVYALLQHPEQMAILRRDRRVIRLAVEEFVRWTNPVISLMRTATADVQIGGRTVRAGDRVVCWVASANRDEEVFERPDEFDVTRHPNRHLGFGAGPHFCLGGPLAKIELRCAVEQLLERYEGIELTGAVERVHSLFVGGLKHMPVRLRRRRGPAPRQDLAA
jgi:cytochrome P450